LIRPCGIAIGHKIDHTDKAVCPNNLPRAHSFGFGDEIPAAIKDVHGHKSTIANQIIHEVMDFLGS
jgi:hypothetical protein